MPQPKLEYISIAVARIVGDEILNMTASSDGNSYTATQRINAINSARQNLYLALLEKSGEEMFANLYQEFVRESPQTDITNNVAVVPDSAKFVLSVKFKPGREADNDLTDDYIEATSVPREKFYKATYNVYSPYRATEDDYKYYEVSNVIVILGMSLVSASMRIIYLEDCIPVTLGVGDDIPDPDSWRQKTIDEAARILTADEQSKLKI